MSSTPGDTRAQSMARAALIFRVLGLLVALVLIAFAVLMIYNFGGEANLGKALLTGQLRELQEAELQGPPLRTAQGGADLVYLLTRQDETITQVRLRRTVGSQPTRNLMHVDLWALDAATLQPAWRKRLRTFENKELSGFDLRRIDLLGADGQVLWLLLGDPLAVSLKDGSVVADAARIEARNPFMAGKRVNQLGYVAFGRHGLQLTLDDASQWRVAGDTFEAKPRDTPAPDPAAIVAPASAAQSSGSRYQLRGIPIGNRWLGVLTDAEAEILRNKPVVPGRSPDERPGAMQEFLEANHTPQLLSELPQPYRLWSARVAKVSAAPRDWPSHMPDNWGTRDQYSDYAALPDAPTFLTAGLLRDHSQSEQALWYRDPDSVLVLHHDKLGEAGRLKLARVAGPGGRVIWDAPLQVSELVSVLRGGVSDLVFLGLEPVSAPIAGAPAPSPAGIDPDAVRDRDQHERLTRIDIATGAIASFDLTAASVRAAESD